MSNQPAQQDHLEQACSLVGRFMYHFGRLEQKINQALIKLSDLDEKVAPILGIIDFVRKLDLVRDSAYAQVSNTKDGEQFVRETYKRVHAINNYRRMIAHSSFEPNPGGGVQFKKTTTKGGIVRPTDEPWTEMDFSKRYTEMSVLEAELDKLIELLNPIPFGWYVPWQHEMIYRQPNLALRAAAMNELVEVPRPPDPKPPPDGWVP